MRDGESLVQQNANTGHFATPYKFNAKELDMETGNYYYGARYYNPQTSMWFGVEPLAYKFLQHSSYAFALNNPIFFVDNDGLDPITAIAEAVSSFVLSAGMDYLEAWIFQGYSSSDAFGRISWLAAGAEAGKTYLSSFIFSGAGTARKLIKISNSKLGKMVFDASTSMTISITKKLESGEYESLLDVEWEEEFLLALFGTLLSRGLSKRANELKESFKASNKKLYTKLDKLSRNTTAGKSDVRIKRDQQQVSIHRGQSIKTGVNYLTEKTKTAVKKKVAKRAVDYTYGKIESKFGEYE
jgi:RHS repeat-associated protein